METKLVEQETRQQTRFANSVDEGVSESRTHREVGATKDLEPEEDIDALEPGTEDKTLPENETPSRIKTTDEPKMKNQDSTGVSLYSDRETELDQVPQQFEVLQPLEESENPQNICEDMFLPPPPPLGALLIHECYEKGGFSKIDGPVEEWIRNVDMISEPTEDVTSLERKPHLSRPFDRHADLSVEMAEESIATEEIAAEVDSSPDTFKNRDPELKMSGVIAGQDPIILPSDGNKSDEGHIINSPPFADECDEAEEECTDVTTLIHQPSHSEISTMPVVPSTKQQEELLPQNQSETAPRLGIQEAVQQVQHSPPLSTVAIELFNQGGAASEGTKYVAEQHRRAGERIAGERQQTGGEEVQKETGLKPEEGGLLTHSTTVQREQRETEKYSCVSSKFGKLTRMESDSCDDSQSDSGVSADFSPCSTLVSHTTVPADNPAPVPNETPIEREIRRAIEREHSLRRSRGLPNLPVSPEFVEIPLRKSVLSQSLVAKSERGQGKDFSGTMMQREIQQEARREQDLVKLGKVPGVYDKGTVRQLKERKQLFEAFQQSKDATSTRSKTTSSASSSDFSQLKNKEDISPSTSKVGSSSAERRRSTDLLSETQNPKGYRVIIIENNLGVPAQNYYTANHSAQEQEEEVAPKENPFFKLRSSTALVQFEQDIKEAQEREKELRKQRTRMYAGTRAPRGGGLGGRDKDGGGRGRPACVDKKNLTLSPLPLNGLSDPGSSSKRGTGPSAVHQSIGMWPPSQVEKEQISQPEILKSPQAPKQKTLLVQRWESGLVNGHNKEDN